MSISACFGKNFCTSLPVLTWPSNSWGSWIKDLSGLCYVSDITPSCNGEFFLESLLSTGLISIFSGLSDVGICTGLGDGQ